ncbi:MAG: glycine C-acetyltransferase [Alphaproteobacteria bacterium]|nr:glycine C-acetyltransferase [Alphaproteobacteria bacterium]
MTQAFLQHLATQISDAKDNGLFKTESVITSAQDGEITLADGRKVLNFCANNYLGLAHHPTLEAEAKQAIEDHGYGMASVRFICGTQDTHRGLEQRLAEFLGFDDCILYPSCFDANTGLFETLLGAEDAIISDRLNHASIIDGVRLCKAKCYRYNNNDMQDLEQQLIKAQGQRFRLIATDGVFSMDGIIANLKGICDLAKKYDAMVMVDECHATGFLGARGRGSIEYCNVMGQVDIVTGTLGKALGGASGGYTAAKAEMVSWLRQRSRPYLFSNSLVPLIAQTTMKVLDMIEQQHELRQRLQDNTQLFRSEMTKLGFTLAGRDHPIIPVMLFNAKLSQDVAAAMLKKGVYVIGFFYPVVPEGQARIRTQMSAAHSTEQVKQAITAFAECGREFGIIS